jgi:selenium metabolism protein YedF
MEEKLVDARGKLCPQPLIMTRKALKELATGQCLRILVDNETSKENVVRFLTDNGFASLVREDKGVYTLHVTKTKEDLPKPDAEAYCTAPAAGTGPHVIVISSDKMGSGPDDLGAILMKAFVNTIKEVKPLPAKIVFYNSGILLTVEGSPLVESLKELESLGVTLLVCGTCVNYFQKQNLVRAGTISNMYVILETLTAAGTVIRP